MVLYDSTDGRLITNIQFQKKMYEYAPSEVYWLFHFSTEVLDYDTVIMSSEEKNKTVKNIKKSSLQLDLFPDLEY